MDDLVKRREHFLKRCSSIYGEGKYDYSETVYVNSITKVKIRCIKHNFIFEVMANDHAAHGRECPKCAQLRKRGLEVELPNDLSYVQRQIIIGSLLGDGSLDKDYDNRNSRFFERHCNRQEGYLSWKKDILFPFSLPLTSEKANKIIHKVDGKILRSKDEFYEDAFRMRTRSHSLFTKLRNEWYVDNDKKERVKIIPGSIEEELTWLSITVWFMDDGSQRQNRREAKFATMSFTKEECEKLVDILFRKFGIESFVDNRRQIVLRTSSFFKFISLIRDSFEEHELAIPECMKYKFDLSEYQIPNHKPRAKLNSDNIKKIFKMSENGWSQSKIAKEFNVSRACVGNLLSGKTFKD